MNNLLLFFALPVSTIILAIVIEKILMSPILTAATFFAVYLIVTFAIFDINFLVYAIVYTIIALITALITEFIFRRCEEEESTEDTSCTCLNRRMVNELNIRNNISDLNNGKYNYRYCKK